ncbi:Methyl-accepting chemotaxis protein McpB [Sporomusa ovata DSM 2662]|uniref:Methyl-accepting chemotaxis protein n=1 Tax=Sporomusa ovata TaxID=2378 RepID=A0A0U1KV16_9FIRM|nr:methyl-accepting chemotaxis protein [Sporomusa ovata]EQB26651.1 methyl-accepting chemotaxis protein [Sporomusa ovata DSM 2662]CQR70743.1 Methyl-accepting chemotaxis protein [Sporomusa ovata]
MKITSLKKKLLLILLPFFTLSFLALSGIGYYLSEQALSHSVNETAEAISSDYAQRVGGYIYSAKTQLQSFASIRRIYNPADEKSLLEAMNDCQNHLDFLENITYVYLSGSGLRPDGSRVALGDRDYFKKAVQTQKPAVSDIIVSRTTGKAGVNVAVPVFFEGKLTGVLTGAVSMEKLLEVIKDAKFQNTGYAMVLDSSGSIIIHPRNPELIGKLSFGDKTINPELNLKATQLDERLVNLFKDAAASGKPLHGKYSFEDDAKIGTITPIDLIGGQRWFMMVTAPEAEAEQQVNSLARALLIASLICFILAIIFVPIVSGHIAAPIAALRDECLVLAGGDLRAKTSDITSHDEVGQLQTGFANMRSSLSAMVIKMAGASNQVTDNSISLSDAAEQIGNTAGQVAAAIGQIAEGATHQAQQITQVKEKMISNSDQINAGLAEAGVTLESASRTSTVAAEGVRSLNGAIEQLGTVRNTVHFATESIQNLGRRSEEIGSIVGIITGIAGQTNLLALNAAIEAARAGEQGRGFAVVAEEVRKLAEESAQAAQQIGNLIRDIQAETSVTVRTMESNLEQVDLQVNNIEVSGQAMNEVIGEIAQSEKSVGKLKNRLQVLADDIAVIQEALVDVASIVEETAASSQEVAAAAEEQSASTEEMAALSKLVAGIADELQALVSQFQV